VIDTREQLPWTFEDVTIGTGKSVKVIDLQTVSRALPAGDYSIEGFETRIAIERKSKEDLFNTLCRGRDRFTRELQQLNEYDFAAVFVEAEWSDCMKNPPASKFAPVSLDGTINAFMIRFPRVHWVFRPGRYVTQKAAFKLMDRFFKELVDGSKSI